MASDVGFEHVDVVVVGAGFAGLYAVHRLRELGFSVRAFEAGGDVGGTWYWNRYPGARCDIESLEYSYSFSPALQQEWVWSRRYPEQPEMLRYAQHVADRFALREAITFGTRVTSAEFDTDHWAIRTDAGHQIQTRFCVLATGCLSAAQIPEIAGRESFAGATYHTARWPQEGVDFAGQRVAVIGTGASGIQAVPLIAEQADHLTVFQRTANFSVAGSNEPLPRDEMRERQAHYAEFRERARRSFGGVLLRQNRVSALAVSEVERAAEFASRWGTGGFSFMAAFDDLIFDPAANEHAAEFVRQKIRDIVTDPATADLLTPRDHPIGTKRICVDSGYYATFNRNNVTLVDLRATPIERLTPGGLRVGGQEYAVDSIVFATGFDAMTGAVLRMDIRGRDARTIQEKWSGGPTTYLGLAVAGFPNLFLIAGPGSPSVISNAFLSIEQHVDWIGDCLVMMRDQGLATIEAEPEAEAAWVDHVNEVADRTLYVKADSWYLGANVPGKPRMFMPYIGGVSRYRKRCDAVAATDYEGFTTS
ncbi:flavin-containing monooxygenase [Cryptosporangium aurantiacum]|uniref:Cyclohexanone monooxygenase n=1 Tax=Cryptosporangium aurantiacum TaxID=134849 RepID=A0A1M7PN62_9ACTN|nr:NAD(P)/FAD-dependent oxidoreductase [Cryptosporangium aurantiacum]SHN18535.1 cyclohexanone monooxygenase [Cryptosporangium aurantiacum]